MNSANNMIRLDRVTRKYGDKTAVDNVSFTIEKGETVGLLGPNGSGKTTIMKMITGYLAPTDGTITVDGIDVAEQPHAAAEKIGFLPENPPLYPDMEVEEYLNFIAEIKGAQKNEKAGRVVEVLETAQISHVKERVIANLSKGYRQRVGLAQALLGLPEILILDEPTVGLDPNQIADFRGLMLELSKSHTIIFSTHILSEIDLVCQKVVILDEGRLVAADSMETLQHDKKGEDSFLLRVACGREKAEAILRAAAGKNSAFECDSAEGLWFRVSAPEKLGLRQKVFFEFAKEGVAIEELKNARLSLEQVFLELTSLAREKKS